MKARCDKCNGTGEFELPYLEATVIPDLLRQTPKEIWQEYLANGYTLHDAAREELSYA